MEIKRFGNPAGKTILLLHSNLMCWRQFEDVIPLLENDYCVYAVSFDGFDGTGRTAYTTAQEQARSWKPFSAKPAAERSISCLPSPSAADRPFS